MLLSLAKVAVGEYGTRSTTPEPFGGPNEPGEVFMRVSTDSWKRTGIGSGRPRPRCDLRVGSASQRRDPG